MIRWPHWHAQSATREADGRSQPSVVAAAPTRKALVPYPEALFRLKHDRGGIRSHSSIRIPAIASGRSPRTPKPPAIAVKLVQSYEFKNDTYVLLSDGKLDAEADP